ncbi:MAG TPA: hypothetical protein VNL94_04845 [Candidatus Binatia bacterium]|nr:hypothetical protein [Candidatus Binatia bacterium]
MRPSRTVAGAALTAALALAAVPGLVGSREPSPTRTVDAALFDQVDLATPPEEQGSFLLDASGQSDGALDDTTAFRETGPTVDVQLEESAARAQPQVAQPPLDWSWKPPKYVLTGIASFYDYGTTAMRDVPRGTTIVICGTGGCIERVVNDYGPSKAGGRLIDMYRPDFFQICGCGWWSGTTQVTVRVY